MTSPVDICNLALSHIGERSDINSIDPPEASTEAQRCAQFYPMTRKTLLAMHPWSFATKRVAAASLSPSEDIPLTWLFVYGLPSDALRITGVYDPGEWRDETYADHTAYEIGSSGTGVKVLYSNIENAVIRYTFDQTDTTLYSPLFVEAFSWLLAGRLAGPTIKGTEGMKVGQGATQQGMAWAAKAAAEDANQAASRKVSDDNQHRAPWIESRGSNLWGRTDY